MSEKQNKQHQELIEESWQRCEKLGLDHSTQPDFQRLNQGELSDLRDEHRFLVQTTGTEVLPYYENILANSQSLILLADQHGQILNTWGDRRFLEPIHRDHLQPGVAWREKFTGTNAIGTALASGQAVQVQRDEHFLKANRFMIGSAAPIFNANRDLLGVLDISSDAYLPHSHTFGMVKLMTQSVENRLIFSMFSDEQFLLTFNANEDIIDSQWSGLIVFNDEGTIISANRRAELLLSYDLALANIEDIFDCSLRDLKNHPEQQPMGLLALGKYRMHGLIRKPSQQVVQAVDFRQPKASRSQSGIITLDQISLGDERVNRAVLQAKRLFEKDIPILIHGETGVGKEVFVSALHEQSVRSKFPLMAVNCAAIPSELVESELFGYEKGAFTGANAKGSIGLIRKAHKGTLFLDEIGEMPLSVQARLLRVLQERKVIPLGSTEAFPIDIRLVSATNRSLREEVEKGQFRQDLYYRVSGLNLELPPLRDRQDKQRIFQQVHDLFRLDNQPAPLPKEVLELFARHPWPGNIRQLVSVIQIALAMADQDPIEAWHLPDDFFMDLEKPNSPSPDQPASTVNQDQHLRNTYELNEGNISKTAKDLGISRNTLYKRLKELGIKDS